MECARKQVEGFREDTHTGCGIVGELRAEFPDLDFIHEIEIRGLCGWATLAEISTCLMQFNAELVSVRVRNFNARASVIICRIRHLDDEPLNAAITRIRSLAGVNGVLLSHHLGNTRPGSRG